MMKQSDLNVLEELQEKGLIDDPSFNQARADLLKKMKDENLNTKTLISLIKSEKSLDVNKLNELEDRFLNRLNIA